MRERKCDELRCLLMSSAWWMQRTFFCFPKCFSASSISFLALMKTFFMPKQTPTVRTQACYSPALFCQDSSRRAWERSFYLQEGHLEEGPLAPTDSPWFPHMMGMSHKECHSPFPLPYPQMCLLTGQLDLFGSIAIYVLPLGTVWVTE